MGLGLYEVTIFEGIWLYLIFRVSLCKELFSISIFSFGISLKRDGSALCTWKYQSNVIGLHLLPLIRAVFEVVHFAFTRYYGNLIN